MGGTVDQATLGAVIPPKRLGAAMSRARKESGKSLRQLARQKNGWFSARDLKHFEAGELAVDDATLVELAALYEIQTMELLTAREDLEISLEIGTIEISGKKHKFEPGLASSDDVLKRYLALVYSVRDVTVGTKIPLRDNDISVLAQALEMHTDAVLARLHELIETDVTEIKLLSRILGNRLVIPGVGILVAATAVGALILMPKVLNPDVHSMRVATSPPVASVVTNITISGSVQSPSAPGAVAGSQEVKTSSTQIERSGQPNATPGAAPSAEPRAVLPPYTPLPVPADPSGVVVNPDDGSGGSSRVGG